MKKLKNCEEFLQALLFSEEIVPFNIAKKQQQKPDPFKLILYTGNPNDYTRSLKCSADGKTLYFVKGAYVNFYDLKSSKTSEELEHNVDVIGVCTNDMKTIVTTAEDSNVRVWDRTKQVQKISQTAAMKANRIR